jgi:hypothetical protein
MKAKTIKQVLEAILWMYENTLEWTQRAAWRNKKGAVVYGLNSDIHSACLLGAIILVKKEDVLGSSVSSYLNGLVNDTVASWNDRDGRTKQEVIALLKKAINS